MSTNFEQIRALRKARPRNRFVEGAWWSFLAVLILPWFVYDFDVAEVFTARRMTNAQRFFSELMPYPLQQGGFDLRVLVGWAAELWRGKGFLAVQYSLAISVLAIVLASCLAVLLSFFASRRLQFVEREELGKARSGIARITIVVSRTFAMFLRAIPEYIWSFILVMLLGVSAWPAVLALAIHNWGILTKLFSESIDDLPNSPLRALRLLGAGPISIGLVAALPMATGRFLLYCFVRWETCIRESTVIGFLGIVSLGYWVEDARARTFYDQMFFFILLGSVVVFLGDIISTMVRQYLRVRE